MSPATILVGRASEILSDPNWLAEQSRPVEPFHNRNTGFNRQDGDKNVVFDRLTLPVLDKQHLAFSDSGLINER